MIMINITIYTKQHGSLICYFLDSDFFVIQVIKECKLKWGMAIMLLLAYSFLWHNWLHNYDVKHLFNEKFEEKHVLRQTSVYGAIQQTM